MKTSPLRDPAQAKMQRAWRGSLLRLLVLQLLRLRLPVVLPPQLRVLLLSY